MSETDSETDSETGSETDRKDLLTLFCSLHITLNERERGGACLNIESGGKNSIFEPTPFPTTSLYFSDVHLYKRSVPSVGPSVSLVLFSNDENGIGEEMLGNSMINSDVT